MTTDDSSKDDAFDPPRLMPKDLTVGALKRLARRHIVQFENKIRAGLEGGPVDVGQCSRYLEIWQGLETKLGNSNPSVRPEFTASEYNEIQDAIFDGSYNELFEKRDGEGE